jgi:hypothetical protein
MESEMKKGVYILSMILILLGTALILVGLGVIPIISSAHHLRYELGGAFIDLLAICGSILITVKNVKTRVHRFSTYIGNGIFEEGKLNRKKTIFLALFIGVFAILAIILILWITPYGSGVNPDSITYFGAAKSILSGQGYSINGSPITHFPPLYSLFLAATNLAANNIVQAARILNAILYGINLGLVALLVYLTTGRKFLTTTVAIIFFLSSGRLLELHTSAWSEPLFITLFLAGIILLRFYVYKPKLSLLISSAIFLGFASIARYVGIFFLPAVLFIVFFYGSGRNIKQKLLNTFMYLSVTCVPLLVFLIRNIITEGSPTDRILIVHPITVWQYLLDLKNLAMNFITPISLAAGVQSAFWGLVAVMIITQILLLFKRRSRETSWRSIDTLMPLTSLLLFGFYVMFLYISITFFDASTPVDARLLSPIFCITIMGVFSTIWTISKTLKAPLVWWVFLLCVVFSISLKTPDAIRSATTILENGSGYTSKQWQNSATMEFVKLVPDNVKIYSNGPDVLSFLTEKKASSLPDITFPVTRQTNILYDEQVDAMCMQITEKKALLVYFNQIIGRWYFPTQKQLGLTCNLPVLRSFDDGIVLGDMAIK